MVCSMLSGAEPRNVLSMASRLCFACTQLLFLHQTMQKYVAGVKTLPTVYIQTSDFSNIQQREQA